MLKSPPIFFGELSLAPSVYSFQYIITMYKPRYNPACPVVRTESDNTPTLLCTSSHSAVVQWLPARPRNIFNVKGLFHIVLQSLSTGRVDTILVLSFVYACQNTKPFNYLFLFLKKKLNTNPYF